MRFWYYRVLCCLFFVRCMKLLASSDAPFLFSVRIIIHYFNLSVRIKLFGIKKYSFTYHVLISLFWQNARWIHGWCSQKRIIMWLCAFDVVFLALAQNYHWKTYYWYYQGIIACCFSYSFTYISRSFIFTISLFHFHLAKRSLHPWMMKFSWP